MTKNNWIKALPKYILKELWMLNLSTRKDLFDFISQVEKDAEERGYQLGLRDGIKKEHENSGAWTDLNKQGVINTHKLIKDAIEKRTKLLEDSFKHRTKPVVNLDDENKNCKVCGYDHEYMVEDNENAYKVAHLKVELSQAIEKTNKRCRKERTLEIFQWLEDQGEISKYDHERLLQQILD